MVAGRFAGKVALITGGGTGIGAASAKRIADEGGKVVVMGRREAPLRAVMEAAPDIVDHNLETVQRLQKPVRKRARWERSLEVIRRAKEMAAELGNPVHTKSSLMVGLGEERAELTEAFQALRAVDCDVLTIGQYLRPTAEHLPLVRYYTPAEFNEMRDEALALGFKHVESGPLVRSSYHAADFRPELDVLEAIEADVRATKGLEVGPEHLRLPKLKSGLVSGLN